jgi:hypothetical protein
VGGVSGLGAPGGAGEATAARVVVRVSSHLHAYTKGAAEVEVEVRGGSGAASDGGVLSPAPRGALTLDDVLRALDLRSPGVRFRLVDEQDRLRPHMSFFIGGERVRSLAAPVGPGQEVCLLGALSGG